MSIPLGKLAKMFRGNMSPDDMLALLESWGVDVKVTPVPFPEAPGLAEFQAQVAAGIAEGAKFVVINGRNDGSEMTALVMVKAPVEKYI